MKELTNITVIFVGGRGIDFSVNEQELGRLKVDFARAMVEKPTDRSGAIVFYDWLGNDVIVLSSDLAALIVHSSDDEKDRIRTAYEKAKGKADLKIVSDVAAKMQ